MRRSKTGGAQRRRSSLKFGLRSVHETKILPTENANFSFDTGSTNANTRGGQLHSSQNFPSTFPPDQTKQRMSTAHDPIPMPSSHIHRTASELNLIIGQKHAVKREKAMFERIVSDMVDSQSDGQITVSFQSSSTATRDHTVETKKSPRPSASRSASVCSLEEARDASRNLLQRFTISSSSKEVKTTSATRAVHDDSAAIVAEQDEFFVGSFRDYAKLTPPRLRLKLQEAALGIDAPLPTDRRRFSDVKSDRSSEIEQGIGEFSDDDELFPLDL